MSFVQTSFIQMSFCKMSFVQTSFIRMSFVRLFFIQDLRLLPKLRGISEGDLFIDIFCFRFRFYFSATLFPLSASTFPLRCFRFPLYVVSACRLRFPLFLFRYVVSSFRYDFSAIVWNSAIIFFLNSLFGEEFPKPLEAVPLSYLLFLIVKM